MRNALRNLAFAAGLLCFLSAAHPDQIVITSNSMREGSTRTISDVLVLEQEDGRGADIAWYLHFDGHEIVKSEAATSRMEGGETLTVQKSTPQERARLIASWASQCLSVIVEKVAADPIRLISPTIEYAIPLGGWRDTGGGSCLYLGSDTTNAVKVDFDEIGRIEIGRLDKPAKITSPSGKQTMATILGAWDFVKPEVMSKPPVLAGYDPVTLQLRRYPLAGIQALTFEKPGANAAGPAANPVPLAEVHWRGIAGELGVPLGKMVTIHGVAVDGNTLHLKDAEGKMFVRVQNVDDQQLASPVLLELSVQPLVKDRVKMPVDKQSVDLVGYETGEYTGMVEHEMEYVGLYQAKGYRLETRFVVVKAVH